MGELVDEPLAADLAEVLHPVGHHPVVGDTVGAVVPRPLTGHLLVERRRTTVGGLERVAHLRVAVLRRARGPPEAVHVHAHAHAIALAVLLAQAAVGPGLRDEAARVVAVLGDEPAELVDALGVRRVHPRVAGDDAGVGRLLEEVEGAVGGLDALVVELDEHLALHHPLEGVLPQVRQAAAVAVRSLGIDREDGGQARPSMSARVQPGTSRTCLQPNGLETSMPRTTASLPSRTPDRRTARR